MVMVIKREDSFVMSLHLASLWGGVIEQTTDNYSPTSGCDIIVKLTALNAAMVH